MPDEIEEREHREVAERHLRILEALLFASAEPLSTRRIARSISPGMVEDESRMTTIDFHSACWRRRFKTSKPEAPFILRSMISTQGSGCSSRSAYSPRPSR